MIIFKSDFTIWPKLVSIIPIDIAVDSVEDSAHSEKYFIDRIFRSNKIDFRPIGISAETISNIKKIVETETKIISGKLNDSISNSNSVRALLPDYNEMERMLSTMSSEEIFTTESEPRATIFITSSESFIIISNERETIDILLTKLDNDLQKLSDITKDFGLDYIGLVRGEKYVFYMLKRVISGKFDYKNTKPKNDFESKVVKYVASLTDCFSSNIEIHFDVPEETFEYDVVIPFGEDSVIDIEVKDYTSVKDEQHVVSESLKSKLILNPVDKAKRLNAKLVVITNGFPAEIFEQLNEFAISRDVILLHAKNYKNELQSLLIDQATEIVSQRGRMRVAKARRLGRYAPLRARQ